MSDTISGVLFGLVFAVPGFVLVLVFIFLITKLFKINVSLIRAVLLSIVTYVVLGIISLGLRVLLFHFLYSSGNSNFSNNNIVDVIFLILSWPILWIGFKS